MKKPVSILAGLIAAATLMLSASAAMAHGVDARDGYHPQRHAAPARHEYRPAYGRHYRHDDRRHYRHERLVRSRYDRDGDGVPNRYDARPNNPRRY